MNVHVHVGNTRYANQYATLTQRSSKQSPVLIILFIIIFSIQNLFYSTVQSSSLAMGIDVIIILTWSG